MKKLSVSVFCALCLCCLNATDLQNAKILFLGDGATAHAACFESVCSADPSVAALNLSIDAYQTNHILSSYYQGRQNPADGNEMLDLLEGYDYIILFPIYHYPFSETRAYQEIRAIANYRGASRASILFPMLWSGSDWPARNYLQAG